MSALGRTGRATPKEAFGLCADLDIGPSPKGMPNTPLPAAIERRPWGRVAQRQVYHRPRIRLARLLAPYHIAPTTIRYAEAVSWKGASE